MTPDQSDLGGLVALLAVTTISSVVIAAAVYVWMGLAMSRLFSRLAVEPWRGWVPLLNLAEVLALGGSPRWIALLFLVPFANIYALVMFAIAAHRVNALFGRGAGMTVLAVLVTPAWASVLAWGRATPDPERGRLATAVGGPARPTGPLAVPPEPVATRPAANGPQPAPLPAPAGERAFPPLPGLEHQVPVRPGAHRSPAPAEPPTPVPPPPRTITPPPGVESAPGWPASPPARPAYSPPGSPAAPPTGSPAAPPTGRRVRVDEGAPEHPPAVPASHAPTAPPAADGAPMPTDGPATGAPASDASAADAAAPSSPTARPWAPGPDLATPGSGHGPAAPATPAHHADDHAEGGLDFADAATIIGYADEFDEEGDVEATVVVDRRPRRAWRIELDDGDVLSLTDDVVILGRNPSAGVGEQRLAVPDRTRTLSKTHARLAQRNGVWTITDLGSTNGVLIVDHTGEETLIEPNVETTISGRFVLGEVGMRVTEVDA